MRHRKRYIARVLMLTIAIQTASAAEILRPAALPAGGGKIVGAAFSRDSNRLALIRAIASNDGSAQRHVLQIVDLASLTESAHTEVLAGEQSSLTLSPHSLEYSSDGLYLLAATEGSDIVSIIDAANLRLLKQIRLHPDANAPGPILGLFQSWGAGSLTTSAIGQFGVLTHHEGLGNEFLLGSFSEQHIISRWYISKGKEVRIGNLMGRIEPSLSDDGSSIAVSVPLSLYDRHGEVRLYNARTGEILKSIETAGLVGPMRLLPNGNVLAARIDTPGMFSPKLCIEKLNMHSSKAQQTFCDPGRHVFMALGWSTQASLVVGFAAKIRRDPEQIVYEARGRIDVWDIDTSKLLASSDDTLDFVRSIEVSPDGRWVFAGQVLLRLGPP